MMSFFWPFLQPSYEKSFALLPHWINMEMLSYLLKSLTMSDESLQTKIPFMQIHFENWLGDGELNDIFTEVWASNPLSKYLQFEISDGFRSKWAWKQWWDRDILTM